MSDWSAAGLPLPQKEGYEEILDPGIQRTPFYTSHPSQTIREKQNDYYSLTFLLTQSKLKAATNFIESQGYSGFTIDLVNGETTIRIMMDYAVNSIGYNTYKLTLKVDFPNE